LKPRVRALRALLWAIWNNEEVPNLPPPGLTTLSKNGEVAREFYEAIGFVEIGDLFIRADILDRVSTKLIRQAKSGVFSLPDDFPPSLGLNLSKTQTLVRQLGYVVRPDGSVLRKARKRHLRNFKGKPQVLSKTGSRKTAVVKSASNSPFAKLAELRL
jgi:hypothetical protein